MADDDDDLGDWGDKLQDKNAPAIGVSKEMLRKALSLNPSLRKGQSSTDIMAVIQQGHRETPPAGASKSTTSAAPVQNFAAALLKLKDDFESESKRLKSEIAALQAQEKALVPRICDRLVDAVLAVDPNMTSPMTQEVLGQEKGFLGAVGFSTKKVLEKLKTRR